MSDIENEERDAGLSSLLRGVNEFSHHVFP